MVYDHGYRGTGNWAFNTAYAATLVAGDSYVTRMRDLREAEDHIVAGVPLVVSIAFGRNQLAGAPISASNGHLLVVVGFEADGDVVVNDPAGADNGRGAPRLRPRAVRADLDRRLRRDGVRHPQQLSGAQPALNSTVCSPVAPSGSGARTTLVWVSPSRPIARTRTSWSPSGTSSVTAHCTQVSTDGRLAELGALPGAAVELHLDRLDPGVLVPGDAAERHLAGGDVGAGAGHVDARGDLDRPERGPALVGPVADRVREAC